MQPLSSPKTSDRDVSVGTDGGAPVAFRFHPRALAALGRNLVTNDVVAVMELVKNSYDALATKVEVRIRPAGQGSDAPYIEIADDGHGMDYATIVDVWCVIATPFREENPVARIGRRARSVTGEKGLGRLSAARLGRNLDVITRTPGGTVLQLSLDWEELQSADDLADTTIKVYSRSADAFDGEHGTRIRIGSLRSSWGQEKVDDLRGHLARLVSPFAKVEDFSITLDASGDEHGSTLEIAAPEFMAEPKYMMKGGVTGDGTIRAEYSYRPIGSRTGRERELLETWPAVVAAFPPKERKAIDVDHPDCGPFQFEIRAWDLTTEDTRDIAEVFGEARSRIRGAISSQRGISVYRDDILVLPKSDGTRDWLGLDVRRISRVGPRLSTRQVVGYVRITKAANPRIVDTSDREGLVSNSATVAFEALIFRIVALLEIERHSDRMAEKEPGHAKDLFAKVTAVPLIARLEALQDGGGDVGDAIKAVQAFDHELDQTRVVIEKRFGYYSRLAVIGTIAQLVIHEIRNRTTVIGRGLRKARELAARAQDRVVGQALRMAKTSIVALDVLADRFAPLASRGYRPGRRTSIVEESIDRCLAMHAREIQANRVTVDILGGGRTAVRIDPSEIDAIVLNLVLNALYWTRRHTGERRLRFRLADGPKPNRVTVSLDDSGPGLHADDRERVFWPGVTRKPDGFGMGLTVASELVDGHGGKMRTVVPGELGGATFEFDLPLAKTKTDKGQL